MTTLLAWLAAFLLVLALFGVLGEKLEGAPLGLRVLVISGVLVLVMANVVMPLLSRTVPRLLAIRVARHTHGPRAHGHSHGLVARSIRRSRSGLRAVALALGVLGATALAQAAVLLATDSVALLSDLIHNGGDALTAVPLGAAFVLRSARVERYAGLVVVGVIVASACVAAAEAVARLLDPSAPDHLAALALAGAIGFAGNAAAARIRSRAGRRLDSPALVADGDHARADALVSLGVVASAAFVWLGAPIADPLIGLAIALLILYIARQSWQTMHADEATA